MKNKWLKKSKKGKMRISGMVPAEIEVDLPAYFDMISQSDGSDSTYFYVRDVEDPNGSLVWKRRTVFEVNGEEKTLKYKPKYSVSSRRIIFTEEKI